jgi:hypothetical protein
VRSFVEQHRALHFIAGGLDSKGGMGWLSEFRTSRMNPGGERSAENRLWRHEKAAAGTHERAHTVV